MSKIKPKIIRMKLSKKTVIEHKGESWPEVDVLGQVNLKIDKAVKNVEHNIRLGLPQLRPHLPQPDPVVVCAGGPSLKRYIKNIKKRYDQGAKLVSVNGTHEFLQEHGMKPVIHVQLDGRPFMDRFVKNPIDSCAYFIASHSDPAVFEALKNNRVYIFHTDYHNTAKTILKDYYRGNFMICEGGSTVTLRTIFLLSVIGRRKQEIFGFDSCFLDGEHHAYPQPENDRDKVIPIVSNVAGYGRREFWCAPWMVTQALEFQNMMATMGDNFDLAVYGPGLIAHYLRTEASIEWPQELGNSTIQPEESLALPA